METPQKSHLFTIRVWREEIDTTQNEWRGKVQLLSSGEVRYFRDWQALAPLLLTMLKDEPNADDPVTPDNPDTCSGNGKS